MNWCRVFRATCRPLGGGDTVLAEGSTFSLVGIGKRRLALNDWAKILAVANEDQTTSQTHIICPVWLALDDVPHDGPLFRDVMLDADGLANV